MSDTASEKQQVLQQVVEVLQECEQHFRAVWEYVSDAIALSTADGTVFAANTAYFHLYGYQPEEIIGKNYSIIFPKEQRKSAQELYGYIFQSPTISTSFEVTIMRADGTERFVESRYNFITHNGTRIAMISIVHDITKRKRAEEALRDSELKLHLALKAGRMGTWDWDIAANTILCSANLEAAIGLVPGGSGISYEAFLEFVHPQDRTFVKQEVKQALEEGTDYQVEFRAILPDGTVRRLKTYGEVLSDEAGKPARMVGVVMDNSSRQAVEDHSM